MDPVEKTPETRRWSHRIWMMPLAVLAVAGILKLTQQDEGSASSTPPPEPPPVQEPMPEAGGERPSGGLETPTLGRPDALLCRLRLRLSQPLPDLPGVAGYTLRLQRPQTASRPPRAQVRLIPGDRETLIENLRPGPYEITLRAEAAPGMQGQADLELGSVVLSALEQELTLELSTAALRRAVADGMRPR